jgi:hypothetical protein
LSGDLIESFDVPRCRHSTHRFGKDLTLRGDDDIGGNGFHVELAGKNGVLIEIHLHRHVGSSDGRKHLRPGKDLGFHLPARPTPLRPKMDENQPIRFGCDPARRVQVLEPNTLRILGADRRPPPEDRHQGNRRPEADFSHGTHSQENGNVNNA